MSETSHEAGEQLYEISLRRVLFNRYLGAFLHVLTKALLIFANMHFLGILILVAVNVVHVACKYFRPPVQVTPQTFEDVDLTHQQSQITSPLGGSSSLNVRTHSSEHTFENGHSNHSEPQGNPPRGCSSTLMVKTSSSKPLVAMGRKHYARDGPSSCIISNSVSSREMALAPKPTNLRGIMRSKRQSHVDDVACGVCGVHCQELVSFWRRDPQKPVMKNACFLWRTGAVVATARKRSLDESSDGFSYLENYKNSKRSARVNRFTYKAIGVKGDLNNITWVDPIRPNWISRTGRFLAAEHVRFSKQKYFFHSNDASLRSIRVDASNKRAYVPEGALHEDVISDALKAWANKRLEPERDSGSGTQVYRFQWSGNMIAYKSSLPGFLRWLPSGSSENPKRIARGDSFAVVPDRPDVPGYSKTPVGFDTASEKFVKRQKRQTERVAPVPSSLLYCPVRGFCL